MRLRKSYLLTLIVLMIISVFIPKNSSAESHELELLEINVFIQRDGSAVIKERRVANLIEGTENYIIIDNLGKSKITDFKVTENKRQYQFVESWNIDDSREDKAFKNGIIDTSSGYELSWGIGEYGRHEYFLEYTVTNFIKELEDSQMMFWRFQNDETNIPPKNVSVTVESEIPFNEQDQKVWGFGFDGNVEFSDGRVVANSNGPLSSDNYVTILLKLNKDMFLTDDYINQRFEQVKDEAFVDSGYKDNNTDDSYDDFEQSNTFFHQSNKASIAVTIIFTIVGFMFPLIGIVIVVFVVVSMLGHRPGTFKRKYEEQYHRDYPYEGEILDIYYILYTMGLASFNNVLTGFLLKWISEDRIMTSSEEVGVIRKKEKTNIKILNRTLPNGPLEGELFNMILDASGTDNILEEKEFTKWASKNYTKVEHWEKKAKDASIIILEKSRYLNTLTKKKFFINFKEHNLTQSGLKIEENIYKYINFLYDYSLLNEHEAINVKLWDRIMIWAGFLGITEVVQKQFEKLYPHYSVETAYTGNSIYLAHRLTTNVSSAMTSAQTSASSGTGGGTSIGGGGGSFGGGSGGGTR